MPPPPIPPRRAASLSATELSEWAQRLQGADIKHDFVRAVKKGDRQIVYVARKDAIAPRLCYALRGYREISLGKSTLMQAAFGDALADWSRTPSAEGSEAGERADDDTVTLVGAEARGATPGPAAPAFFGEPRIRARVLASAYLPGAIRNRQLDEVRIALSDDQSELSKYIRSAKFPFAAQARKLLRDYRDADAGTRRAIEHGVAAGEEKDMTAFILAWRDAVERHRRYTAAHPGGGDETPTAAVLPDVPGVAVLDQVLNALLPEAGVRDLPGSCCSPSQVTALSLALRDCLARDNDMEVWIAQLAGSMANELADGSTSSLKLGPDGARRRRYLFAMSYGHVFADQLAGMIRPKFDLAGVPLDEQMLNDAIRRAYFAAVAGLDQGSLNHAALRVDGRTSRWHKDLGSGGNGKVALYGKGRNAIALKSPRLKNHDQEEARRHFAAHAYEIRMQGLFARKNEAALPVRSPDGALHIAMPAFPHGGADRVATTLANLVRENIVTSHEAMLLRKLMLKDMATELERLERRKMLHRDVKLQNFCLDGSGRLRLIDFGTALAGTVRVSSDWEDGKIDNPRYTAPEVEIDIKEDRRVKGDIRVLDAQRATLEKKLTREIKRETSRPEKVRLKTLKRETTRRFVELTAELRANAAPTSIDTKADVWSLGIAAYELFRLQSRHGAETQKALPGNTDARNGFHLPFDSPRSAAKVAEQLEEYRKMSPAQRRRMLNLSRKGAKTPDAARDEFLMRLLHPDPARRPRASEVLASPFLKLSPSQENACRAMLVAMASDDGAAMSAARKKLRRANLLRT